MYLQPSTFQYGIKNHLSFLDIEVNRVDHHAVNERIHPNDDTYKSPHPKSSNYYLQSDTAFKRDIYNTKQSRIDVNYEDFQPRLQEVVANRSVNVMYTQHNIKDVPKMPPKVRGP